MIKARAVLADHLLEPGFSVRDWADLLHMDRTTLFRKFKAATNQSPDEALREARLELAAKLLRQKSRQRRRSRGCGRICECECVFEAVQGAV